ncbi:uncharacterized protein LOC110943262 isoform X2 [Helianthus annuus]|uniref:uncharacterized protein LOC110943262 isoform X2 n=1 Tax=Helianthus annuus TaxID=4232 RepID=UPI001652D734|nr:uncharacterized protein LOC110943262 isoform X2 [Helianthus annuus]
MRSNFGKLAVFWIFQAIRVWTLDILGFHCLSGSLPSWVKAAFYLSFHCIIEIFLKKKHWAEVRDVEHGLGRTKMTRRGRRWRCSWPSTWLAVPGTSPTPISHSFSNMFQSPNMGSILLLYTCDTTNHIACRFTDTYTYNTNVNTHTLYMNQKVKAKQWQASFSSTMDNIGIPTRVRLQHADV